MKRRFSSTLVLGWHRVPRERCAILESGTPLPGNPVPPIQSAIEGTDMKRSLFTDGWEFSRDGSAFEPVVVPHDAMLGNKRSADAPTGSAGGYYHGARYRYRKTLELDEATATGIVMLEFEGIYRDAHAFGRNVGAAARPQPDLPVDAAARIPTAIGLGRVVGFDFD